MKKRNKILFVLLLIVFSAALVIIPAYCGKSGQKGLYFVNKRTGQPNLIVITHGWIHKGKGRWPQKMAEAINEKVDSDQWLVGYFDWGKGSATINPVDAVTYARDIAGSAMTAQILKLEKDFRHIHLIGHSSGCWAISEAAKMLVGRINCDTHLTFLDAYVPNDWNERELGDINCPTDVNCWTDHYLTDDMTKDLTGINLTNAHNVSLTEVDQFIKDHNFPWKWYHASIAGKFPKWSFMNDEDLVIELDGTKYGFARSREASEKNWQKSIRMNMGNNAVVIKNTKTKPRP